MTYNLDLKSRFIKKTSVYELKYKILKQKYKLGEI